MSAFWQCHRNVFILVVSAADCCCCHPLSAAGQLGAHVMLEDSVCIAPLKRRNCCGVAPVLECARARVCVCVHPQISAYIAVQP
ncbi:hypothetical protein EON66_05560 [archaeon]|nr:MAG: hypothetical protein EON66_05560 [archaeon]